MIAMFKDRPAYWTLWCIAVVFIILSFFGDSHAQMTCTLIFCGIQMGLALYEILTYKKPE